MPKTPPSLELIRRGPKAGPRPYRRKSDHNFVGLYPRIRKFGIAYSTKCRLPKQIQEILGITRDCVHVGTYDNELIAAAAVDMFYLNLIVEHPWIAPAVMDYLNTLDYIPIDQAAAIRALHPYGYDSGTDDAYSTNEFNTDISDTDSHLDESTDLLDNIQWIWDMQIPSTDMTDLGYVEVSSISTDGDTSSSGTSPGLGDVGAYVGTGSIGW